MSVDSRQLTTIDRTGYRDYSVEEKAEVLALVKANNGNVLRTAQETGIAHQTIRHWLETPERFSELENQKSIELAHQLETDGRYYLQLAREKAPEAPFNHLMTGAAIAIDKMQLLRGQPTSISLDLSRQDITLTLQSALSEVIDVTPE